MSILYRLVKAVVFLPCYLIIEVFDILGVDAEEYDLLPSLFNVAVWFSAGLWLGRFS